MRVGFFIFIVTTFLALVGYVLFRGWQVLSLNYLWRLAYVAVVLSMCICFFLGMLAGPQMPHFLGKTISLFGYAFFIILVYLVVSFFLVDDFRLLNYIFHFVSPKTVMTVRLWSFGVTVLIIMVLLIWGNWKFHHPSVVKFQITTEKQIFRQNLKIVAVSDMHLGVTIDKAFLKRYVKLINEQNPDLILFVGDVVDRSIVPVERQNMKEELRKLKAPMGIYSIYGNHEYFSGNATAIASYLESAGIHLLKDQVVLINDNVYLIGRDDRVNHDRKSLHEIVAQLDNAKPRILIDHQPFHLEEAQKNDIDLQLSGHTHYGQFFPGNIIVNQIYELGYGHKTKGKTHYYVSSGLGIWGPPYRIGSQSEIVVIDFKY